MNNSVQTENGYTKIANELQDAFAGFRIPGEARQILDCIIRKTYGFNRREAKINNFEIVEMTGMKRQNVSRVLTKLIEKKLVIKTADKVRLNKNYKEWVSFRLSAKRITKGLSAKQLTRVSQTADKMSAKQLTDSNIKDKRQYKDNILADKPLVSQTADTYKRVSLERATIVQRVAYHLEDTLDTKIVNWGKQGKAVQMMVKAGYTEEQMKWTITKMSKDEFYEDKGFDLMTVANSIANYKAKVRKGNYVQQAY